MLNIKEMPAKLEASYLHIASLAEDELLYAWARNAFSKIKRRFFTEKEGWMDGYRLITVLVNIRDYYMDLKGLYHESDYKYISYASFCSLYFSCVQLRVFGVDNEFKALDAFTTCIDLSGYDLTEEMIDSWDKDFLIKSLNGETCTDENIPIFGFRTALIIHSL